MSAGYGCLGKARDDEYIFVLLSRDAFAPLTIIDWAQRVLQTIDPTDHDNNVPGDGRKTMLKVAEALELAAKMIKQQVERGCAIP